MTSRYETKLKNWQEKNLDKTLQKNPERRTKFETLSGIAEQCDGVRCDMAMLLADGG